MWQWLKNLWQDLCFREDDMQDLEWINHLKFDQIMEIYSRHVEQVNAVWLEDETEERTLGEAVKIWLRRKMEADPSYDWTTDEGEPAPPPMGMMQLTPESTKPF